MESIDKILAELKTEQLKPPVTKLDNLLNTVKQESQSVQSPKVKVDYPAKSQQSPAIDNLLAELKQEKQLAKKKQAQQWLDALDHHSDDWLWFEEFASKYQSRLDAAVDYLTAMGYFK